MQIDERQAHLKRLIDFQDKQVIKIVTEVRRSGKSTLLKLFAQHLRASGIEDRLSYDIKGKQPLKSLCKYYAIDTGMRQMLLGDRSYDRGRLLENIVYFELLRRYGKVYVGKYGQLEVDFVVETQEGLRYYQVSETVTDPSTLERELRPLQSIKDAYPNCS